MIRDGNPRRFAVRSGLNTVYDGADLERTMPVCEPRYVRTRNGEEKRVADFRMSDGSRNFACLPEKAFFDSMREHLKALGGSNETGFVTDWVTEMWLDFDYRQHKFSINNQMGEYWLFVNEPECPDAILAEVVTHFAQINPK